MAVAVTTSRQANGAWPMTSVAFNQLESDADRLTRLVTEHNGYVTGHLDGEPDAPSFVPNVAGQQARRRLDAVRRVIERAEVVDDPDVAVIGREIVLRESGGATSRYTLVIPGDGNSSAGLISADSPVGSAVMGHGVGDTVTIVAPAGSWTAVIASVV